MSEVLPNQYLLGSPYTQALHPVLHYEAEGEMGVV
jgi:hypothetical protein